MSAQTIKTTTRPTTPELAPASITVVMDTPGIAANAAPLARPTARNVLATLPALAILVAAAWSLGNEGSETILQLALGASGFLFMVLAAGKTEAGFGKLLATGVAILVLALLSATLAAEIAMVGAAVVAAWVSAAIIRA